MPSQALFAPVNPGSCLADVSDVGQYVELLTSNTGVAPTNEARIRLNGGAVQISISGGAYATVQTGGGANFEQNGNSFGALAVLGTNDAYGLALETGGTTWAVLDTAGLLTLNNPGITTTQLASLTLANSTTSTGVVTVQSSPGSSYVGTAWDSVTNGGQSDTHEWQWYVRPATVAGPTTSQLRLSFRVKRGPLAMPAWGAAANAMQFYSLAGTGTTYAEFFGPVQTDYNGAGALYAGGASAGAVVGSQGYDVNTSTTLVYLGRTSATGAVIGPGVVQAAATPTTCLITQAAHTGGTSTILKVTGAAITGQATTVEAKDVYLNLARTVTFATGVIALQRAVTIEAPTYDFSGGASSITQAATVYIVGAPVAGASATIGKSYALWIAAGSQRLALGTAATPALGVLGGGGAFDMGLYFTQSTDRLGFTVAGAHVASFQTTGLLIGPVNTETTYALNAITCTGGFDYGFTLTGARNAASANTDVILASANTRTAGALLEIKNAAVSVTKIDFSGNLTLTQLKRPTGVPTLFTMTGATNGDTGAAMTLSTEVPDVSWDLSRTIKWATGNITAQRQVIFDIQTTLAFVGASTVTNAIGFHITAGQTQGANAAFTNVINVLVGGDGTGAATTTTLTSATTAQYSQLQLIGGTLSYLGANAMTTASAISTMFIGTNTVTSDTATLVINSVASLYIQGAPIQGANVTLTKTYSIFIDAGIPRIDSTTANGTVATVLGSVGPTGSNTTVQEWLTIDINGTTRYIPCF